MLIEVKHKTIQGADRSNNGELIGRINLNYEKDVSLFTHSQKLRVDILKYLPENEKIFRIKINRSKIKTRRGNESRTDQWTDIRKRVPM